MNRRGNTQENLSKEGQRISAQFDVVPARGSSDVLAPEDLQDANTSLMSLLLKNLPLVTYVCKATGDFGALHCGGDAEDITGFPPEKFIEDSSLWVDRLHPDDKHRILRDLEQLFINGQHVQEYRWKRADGSFVWFMDLLRLVKAEDGTPKHIVGAWFDITEKKIAEQELSRYRRSLEERVEERTDELRVVNYKLKQEISERIRAELETAAEKERLKVTLESIADGVIATDTSGTIVFLNRIAEQITGWSERESVGKVIGQIFDTEPEFLIAEEQSNNRYEPSYLQRKLIGDRVLKDRGGINKTIACRSACIRAANGEIQGLVIVFRDTTNERKLEAEVVKAQKLESLGILAGGIAHDFNNILTGILGNISVAKAVSDPLGKAVTKLSMAEKACARAKDLTEQLLTFSKGGLPLKKTMDIEELIYDSVNIACSGTDYIAEFSIGTNLWLAEVDEGQIGQVLSNLVINAQQAMPEGGKIRVSARNVVVNGSEALNLAPGRYLCVSITDSGIGIPANIRERIFDPYFTTKTKGSGLGLTTSYSILKHHCGGVSVESREGLGSSFTIYLPASAALSKTVQDEICQMAVAGGRVLVVDDEQLVLDTATSILTHLGYDVVCASDGAEAVELYRLAKESNQNFDVVILDLTIPGGLGGRDAAKQILDYDPAAKLLVSSGYSNDPVMANFRGYGFRDIVAKPYDLEALSQTLAEVISTQY